MMADVVSTVYQGKNSLQKLIDFFEKNEYSKLFVLVDENTFLHCYPLVSYIFPKQHTLIKIKSGEEHKTIHTCTEIWQVLTAHQADRNSLLVNLGGGVIGDIGGFAAACYKRGIEHINLPTTLLAMVDASVGSKTGVDFGGFKNQVGLFKSAKAVFIHTPFLNTLPEREFISGFAEVIKHYLVSDKDSLITLSKTENSVRNIVSDEMIGKNILLKNYFTKKDPYEKNIRKALNFGHTIGHAVESYFLDKGEQKLLHGEAIAIGMLAEIYISYCQHLISNDELKVAIMLILKHYQLPVIPETCFSNIVSLIGQDKKNESGKNRFTLLNGLGNFSVDKHVEESTIIEALRFYNTLRT